MTENAEVRAFLATLSADYPNFDQWFEGKVLPGLMVGERRIFSIRRDGALVAVGIAKKSADENKICTIRVGAEYRNRGYGPRLIDQMLHWLDDDRPHLTVGAEKLPDFERIFDHYGFRCTSEHHGLYLPDRTELAFNE